MTIPQAVFDLIHFGTRQNGAGASNLLLEFGFWNLDFGFNMREIDMQRIPLSLIPKSKI
jgi:hypothetical protein